MTGHINKHDVAKSVLAAVLLVAANWALPAMANENRIYALRGALWRIQQIPVCWENPTQADQQERTWVEDTATNTWQANSSLTFTGWGQCQQGSAGIHIQIADAGPHTKGLGTNLDGLLNGMVLNFTFNNFSRDFCRAQVPGRREHCIRVIAMHEFGHAIGFAHEQNRPDAPDWCQADAQGSNGDVMVTDFDTRSVMNYCNNASWPAVVALSAFDLIGLRRVYGAPGGPLPPLASIFAVNLTALHTGCDAIDESRHPDCVSAIHRVCSGAGRGGAGVSQEVGADVFGVACFEPSWYGDVDLNELGQHHPGCNNIDASQSPDCMAAVHRWCSAQGHGAGIVQEVGSGVFGVACFNPVSYEDVALSDLSVQHDGCLQLDQSQASDCVAALHRWCIVNNRGQAGIAQEVGQDVLGAACFSPTWYGDIALQ